MNGQNAGAEMIFQTDGADSIPASPSRQPVGTVTC
jgi:hypothetical protein